MKIKFINRRKFESLPGVKRDSLVDSGKCHSKQHHANGPDLEDKLKQIHGFGYATGIRDCISVLVMPDDLTKHANLLHFNTGYFLYNLSSIDTFIRSGLDSKDLQASSTLVLGSLEPVPEFGEEHSQKQSDSGKLLAEVINILKKTGTKIIELTGQVARLNPLAACESHVYVDRKKQVVYVCADYLNVPIGEDGIPVMDKGKIDRSTLVPEGGITQLDKLKEFFTKFSID